MAFATIDDLTEQLGKRGAGADMGALQTHLDGAEIVMRYLIGPSTVETATAEPVRAYHSGKIVLANRPIVAVTAMTGIDVGNPTISDIRVVDANGGVIELVHGRFWGRYDATYTFGRAAVEANQTLAAVIIAQHLWRLKNGGGGGPHPGQDDLVSIGMGYAVPRRALELLSMEPTPRKTPGIA